MKKVFLTLFAFSLIFGMYAQSGTITGIAGKVEYQLPGKTWKPARVGDVVTKGTMISTGFKSTALIKIANATITVKPITRLSLEQIVKTEGGTQTQLYLVSGRVLADVTPQPNQSTDFKVSSPTATASVRGTSFEFDGINLIGYSGITKLQTPTLQVRFVHAGEFTYVSANGSGVEVPAAVDSGDGKGLENVDDLIDEVTGLGGIQLVPVLAKTADIVIVIE